MPKPASHQRIARERMTELLKQADVVFKEHPALSKRYVTIARKISMKYKVPFSKDQKKFFCKKCDAYLVPGKNSTIRLSNGHMVIRCIECGNIRRIVYKK